MTCEQCGKELVLPDKVYTNLENNYKNGKRLTVATICCNRPYYVKLVVTFETGAVNTNTICDDWGTLYERD